jgi:phosphoglycolate phosphatase
MEKKLAVLFPGIGYTCDRPLLYYSGKLAREKGYDLKKVEYGGFDLPGNIINNKMAMKQAFTAAMKQTEEILADVKWEAYDRLLFLSKSVGTAAAACYEKRHELQADNVYYTPVEGTFLFMREESGIAFHGTADPWADDDTVEKGCAEKQVRLYEYDRANHSLETGDVMKDLENLRQIMALTDEYLR